MASFDEIVWLKGTAGAQLPAQSVHRGEHQVRPGDRAGEPPGRRAVRSQRAVRNDIATPQFPKPARAYLDDWAAPDAGWLRKYYPDGSDEPHYDATPAVEKALQWVDTLRERSFVGTESRLNTIVYLLRQIVFGTETDPEERVAELARQRDAIDEQIARVRACELDLLDESAVRDRYQQVSTTARELLADFREVEENLRKLDRRLREKIAGWQGGKGETRCATTSVFPDLAHAMIRMCDPRCRTARRASPSRTGMGVPRSLRTFPP